MIEHSAFVDTIVHTMHDKPENWRLNAYKATCGNTSIWIETHNKRAYVYIPNEIRMNNEQETRLYNEIQQLRIRQTERMLVEVYAEDDITPINMSVVITVMFTMLSSVVIGLTVLAGLTYFGVGL